MGYLFQIMEVLKDEHQLEDYSVGQTTLEQIFQSFADLKQDEKMLSF